MVRGTYLYTCGCDAPRVRSRRPIEAACVVCGKPLAVLSETGKILEPEGPHENKAYEKLAVTEYLVAADGFSSHELWRSFSHEALRTKCSSDRRRDRVEWTQERLGYGFHVGSISVLGEERPVTIAVCWAKIAGALVGFWEDTSVLVDHRMIEEFLNKHAPLVRRHENALNFHNILHAIQGR